MTDEEFDKLWQVRQVTNRWLACDWQPTAAWLSAQLLANFTLLGVETHSLYIQVPVLIEEIIS